MAAATKWIQQFRNRNMQNVITEALRKQKQGSESLKEKKQAGPQKPTMYNVVREALNKQKQEEEALKKKKQAAEAKRTRNN